MFKKKPNIKPLAPIRSSDRRKLADQIIKDFNVKVPEGIEEPNGKQQEEGQTSSPGPTLSSIRNALLPEHSMSAKFTTTAGPDLKTVSGTVYIGSHPCKAQRVLWIKYYERMYPTVYTLWHNPRLVPLLHTPQMVMQKLCDGADLMTPGLARGPPFPSDATKDSIVAVAALESPTVPTAVGVCVIDVNQLAAVRGEKGRAVETVHWSGDELWSWGSGTDTGDAAPEYLTGWDDGDEADEGLPGKMQSMKVAEDGDDQDGGVSIRDHHQADEDKADKSASSQRPNPELFEEVDVIEETLSTKDIDAIFHKAFLYGLHHFKSTKKNEQNHGLDFPVNSSFFMSNLVLPFLPIFTPAQGASLQIKKTSWKNAKKFIKHLEKQHLLRSKDRNGGETVVLEMDFDDPAVAEFVPYKLPKKESGQQHETSEGAPSRDQSIGQQLRRIVLYKPTEKLAPVFDAAHASLKAYYSASEIRSIVMTYIEGEQLISPANKRLVDINPVLANVVFGGQSAIDREVLAKGNVPRDTLVECIITRCSPYWAILSGEETKDKVKPKSGQAPPIQIMLETRTGNKTATKVSGMEAYHISPQALADEMQKACASSTSVGQLAGSSPKHPVMEVLIQGPQSQVVIKALEKRGVQRAWIDVVDKTKGKKR